MTVWTVEAQNWCQCPGADYPVDWDFPSLEEAQDFYNKFWATELSDHHFGWCGEKHTLLLGVKGSAGDLSSYLFGPETSDPQVLARKDWVLPDPCGCRECLQLKYLEEELAAEEAADPSEYLEELLPASFKE